MAKFKPGQKVVFIREKGFVYPPRSVFPLDNEIVTEQLSFQQNTVVNLRKKHATTTRWKCRNILRLIWNRITSLWRSR